MTVFRQITALLRKDLLLEWRGRSRYLSVVLFGVVTLLLFSFAVGPDSQALRAGASGFLVLALLLSSTLDVSSTIFPSSNSSRLLRSPTMRGMT